MCDGGCEFKRVPDYEAYDVSKCGIVRSYWRAAGMGRPRYISDIAEKCDGSIQSGALRISLSDRESRRRTMSCGWVVLRTFCGMKRGYVVGYLDGNKLNNNLSNLKWITPKVAAVVHKSGCSAGEVLKNHKAGILWCNECGSWKSREHFTKSADFRCRVCINDMLRRKAYGVDQSFIERTKSGCCEICGTSADEGKRLAIDHCHLTDNVRGVLCGNCNTAIGMFKDNPVLLVRSAAYLRKNGAAGRSVKDVDSVHLSLVGE